MDNVPQRAAALMPHVAQPRSPTSPGLARWGGGALACDSLFAHATSGSHPCCPGHPNTLVVPHRKCTHPHPAIDLRSRFAVGFGDVDCIEQDMVFGGEG